MPADLSDHFKPDRYPEYVAAHTFTIRALASPGLFVGTTSTVMGQSESEESSSAERGVSNCEPRGARIAEIGRFAGLSAIRWVINCTLTSGGMTRRPLAAHTIAHLTSRC
jgi:hypothetical protein